MDISNVQGANAYTANRQAGENTQVQSQEATRTNVTTQENQGVSQKAFEVTITQEARNQLAEENTQNTQTDQPPKTEPFQAVPQAQAMPQDQETGTGQQGSQQTPSQIVNIVA